MPLPSPEREITSRPRCDAPVQGDGVMSYHCTLPIDHEQDSLDKTDPQPCYAVESTRSTRMWGQWKQRENQRQEDLNQPEQTLIDCPSCKVKSMVVDFDAKVGTCENCGVKVPFQQEVERVAQQHASPVSVEEAEQPGEPWRTLEDWRELDEDVTNHVLGPFFQHLDRYCGYHNRLGKWVFSGTRECLRYHPPVEPDHTLTEDEKRQEERWRMNRGTTLGDAVRGYHATLDEKAKKTCPACGTQWTAEIDSCPDCGHSASRPWLKIKEGSAAPTEAQLPALDEIYSRVVHALDTIDIEVWWDNGTVTARYRDEGAEIEVKPPTKQREGDQRLPAGGDRVVQEWVMQQAEQAFARDEMSEEHLNFIKATMLESIRVGIERYGQPLRTFDGRLNIKDLAEELRDSYVYVSKLQMTAEADRPTLVRMVSAAFSHWDEEYDDRITDHGYNRIAEVAVDRILDWVLVQKIGPEQVLPVVEEAQS